jgi:hypothetical protein
MKLFESQRDSVFQPSVATKELRWESRANVFINPEWVGSSGWWRDGRAIRMGIATVSVAAIGVSPMALARSSRTEHGVIRAFGLFGGTPNSAGETPAIPQTSAPGVARASQP